jgi:hypothetical protein
MDLRAQIAPVAIRGANGELAWPTGFLRRNGDLFETLSLHAPLLATRSLRSKGPVGSFVKLVSRRSRC